MKRLPTAMLSAALGIQLLVACSSTDNGDAGNGAAGAGQSGNGAGASPGSGGVGAGAVPGGSGAGGPAASTGGAAAGVAGSAGSSGVGGGGSSAQGGSATGGSSSGGSATGGSAVAGNEGTAGNAGAAGAAASGGAAGAPSAIPSADRARLTAIRERALALQKGIIGFWKEHGPDAQGGFYGELDRQGNATSATDKFVHAEARHLWTFSTWYRFKEPTDAVKATCDSLFAFVDRFHDASDGRYVYSITRNGSSVKDSKKMLYAQSFVVLALSEYALAFNNQAAKDKALALFRVIDAGHDATNGGYDQQGDAWSFTATSARKSMNVHMHLLESYTNLYRATGDAVVKQRLTELVGLFRTKIVQPEHYYHTEFDLAWAPVLSPAVVEYGHDLQIFWQVVNALEPLGMGTDAAILKELASTAEVGAARGLDGQNGYATNGTPGGKLQVGNKVWWVQAEALNGLLRLYLVTGNAVNLDRIEATLSFVEKAFVDPTYGELSVETGPTGAASDTRKGYEWKASYHALRFALQLDLWIADALE